MTTIELTANRSFKNLLRNRYPQLAILALMLVGFVFAITAGAIGTPVGSANFSIVFIWIAWWAALILVAVPFLGRAWCAICPIPLPGEWMQRGAILGPPAKPPRWLNLRWPRALRSIWLQSVCFLPLALFSTVLLTSPGATAVVLAAMLLAAVGLSLLFQRRSFCRYLCPVGGFIGLYSQAAPIELRIKDKSICVACDGKPCYNGSASAYGCPWDVFPAGLKKNTYCGLCLECLRACPHDNLALNLRPFAADLAHPSSRLDESFKGFVMLGAAVAYSAVLLGPWGLLKDAAYKTGSAAWFVYGFAFLGFVCVALPGIFVACVAPLGNLRSLKRRFATLSTALIPLGLAAWAAFSLSFALNNGSYVLNALSDPLGLGWNLLGTTSASWHPLLSGWLPPGQALVLVGGFLWSGRTAQNASASLRVSPIPVVLYCLVITVVLLWLLL